MNLPDSIRSCLNKETLLDQFRNIEISRGFLIRSCGYLAYGLIVFLMVFTVRYYALQADTLVREAVSGLENVVVEFPHIEPQLLPPRVTVDYLRVYEKKGRKPILLLKDTDIRMSMFPLLIGKASFSIVTRAYGSVVEAHLSTGAMFDTDWLNADVKFEALDLDKIPQIRQFDRTMKGYASLDASLSGEWANPLTMRGDVVASLAQLDMDNRFPIVKGKRLQGFTIDLDCSMRDGLWDIARFDLRSESGISLKVAGLLDVDETSFDNSNIDMEGKLLSDPKLLATRVLDPKVVQMLKRKQAVPIQCAGTIARPNITLKN